MTDPNEVKFTKVDPATGTVTEFKGADGAKVAYDGPHATAGDAHDSPHVGWQSGGKRSAGGKKGNIPHNDARHPTRSTIKKSDVVQPH
jgi:putative RNase toxin 47 of polymorphic toxin system